ncbi:MAG: hypothetical protein AMJ92_02090 [candidate division Zixibacteria bacterium SM23_81]|nr:MAG: hypothetical protein AMJ92_02090 [candidate division Zixibacteria bacterium SM23_81]
MLILVSLAILLAFTFYGPFSLNLTRGRTSEVVLERGLGVREIAAILAHERIIPSVGQFLFLSKFLGVESELKAGRYSFAPGTRPLEVLNSLVRGYVSARLVTIPEGLTIRQMAELLERESGIDAEIFVGLAVDPQVAQENGIQATSLEGYLFPDTYDLHWGMPAHELIDIMISRFRQIYDTDLNRRAAELDMTNHQVITLASMIEEEARIAEERPIISAVYHNRLKKRMMLQCDPTVIYALGGKTTPLTRKDLEVESPYNTYRHYGLPPGPISSPGKASIVAALYPIDVDYLYFVARGDGSHQFSRTSREHINAIRRIKKNLGG